MPSTNRPTCANCGKSWRRSAGPGRPRLYCSKGCRDRAYRRRKLLDAEERGREAAIEELRGRTFLA